MRKAERILTIAGLAGAVVLLAAFGGLEVLLLVRPGMRRRWLVSVAILGLTSETVAYVVVDAALSHMLDNVVPHPGESIFGFAVLVVQALVLAQAIVSIVAAVRAARDARAKRAAAGIPEPTAEERRTRRDVLFDRSAQALSLLGGVSAVVLAVLLFLPWHRV